MKEQGSFVTIAGKTMSVAMKCFQKYIIHPGLASADTKEAPSTRIKPKWLIYHCRKFRSKRQFDHRQPFASRWLLRRSICT
jgi:hypothetical protein